MAKVKGVKKTFESVRERLSGAINSSDFIERSGKVLVQESKRSAYAGRDPSTKEKYPELDNKKRYRIPNRKGLFTYAQYRKALAESNNTSEFYKLNKPMTFTGQLIESIGFKVTKNRLSVIIRLLIDPKKNARKPYKSISGKTQKAPTNKQLEKWHREELKKIRRVIGISQTTTKTIVTQFRALLRRRLR